jgi:hypothetical protein
MTGKDFTLFYYQYNTTQGISSNINLMHYCFPRAVRHQTLVGNIPSCILPETNNKLTLPLKIG